MMRKYDSASVGCNNEAYALFMYHSLAWEPVSSDIYTPLIMKYKHFMISCLGCFPPVKWLQGSLKNHHLTYNSLPRFVFHT